MKYGLVFPNVGIYSDVRKMAELAQQAEKAGWDGFFIWDTLHYMAENRPVADPWIALTAIAMRTQRIKIGFQVTPLPRRRPWKVAREAVTLDHLSNGRLILGVGIGDIQDRGFGAFGEETDARKRARMLDESLAILQGLWSGKPFSYSGEYYHVDEITFLPQPLQQPGIPLWAGWMWPARKPMERAARLNGASPISTNTDLGLTPEEIRQLKTFVEERRTKDSPFDIAPMAPVFAAINDEQARARLKACAEAGMTWALQGIWSESEFEKLYAMILQGPPSL
ncbi:LLM class flavin-dependent oxidoreductase [Ktedonosporobacter rubrisoli]|uniref:LLM class flavin-dependent oxidoreductase n=1 Tax=Ktedonosporobacter rubrisoli TaxID=2509675 RepID=A0A4P6JMD9_KTERU|nr:LLM class flavin-dependent oxidoreductase [Ktedonosporobacter rubrisoli]QBD76394.1 LLM class flavin-dependent oxidoreductase [Ktedonosporobacter rubrisoli]